MTARDRDKLAQLTGDEMLVDPLVRIFEKQKKDLVIRMLKKHEEVEAKNFFISRIMSSLSDLFILFAEDFTILRAGKEFYDVLGWDVDQEGLQLSDIANPEVSRVIRKHFAEGDFRDLETLFCNRQGWPVPVLVRGTTCPAEKGKTVHMLVASDRREFFEVMDRMREVQDQLIHSGRLASLGEMAAGIGHELTQPLNTMLLLARNCQKAMADPLRHKDILSENLSTIIDRINFASSIIHSMKGFAGKAQNKMTHCRVNIILLDVLNFIEAQLELSGVKVKLELEEGDFFVQGQVVRLEQVLLNLIQNAAQSMGESDFPELIIRLERLCGIDPPSLAERMWVVISIIDNGCGIPSELEEKVFDPFFTTREVGVGMGLGLSIVERIVRSTGGFVKMKTAVGRGTTFAVWLPEEEIQKVQEGEE
ncbi:hypothetical protein JWG39_05140 [Desulforhopalus vacuolatus]|uniref:sensor histidine kinase n=1 Tax=Desulforhopalus vacuolatus TaxID=40414 RepID=UPI0019650CBE|nr:ATP-binding protein [Desulforhopalus vacuolatus]MBM9519204.1 hypothetical protein [Desulforhopalus vacuolatus]